MAMEKVDIILPVHNALDRLQECLRTLQEVTYNYRLIIVNDHSDDERMQPFLDEFLRTHPNDLVIKTGKQRWFTRAVNIGLRLVRTEHVVVLNSDTALHKGWLDELFDVWKDFNMTHRGGREIGIVGSVWSEQEQRRWVEVEEPHYVTGHCWLAAMNSLQRAAFKRGTPGWILDETDQKQIHIASDRILCWELNRIGIATIISFKSHVDHLGGASWNYDMGKVSNLKLADVND